MHQIGQVTSWTWASAAKATARPMPRAPARNEETAMHAGRTAFDDRTTTYTERAL